MAESSPAAHYLTGDHLPARRSGPAQRFDETDIGAGLERARADNCGIHPKSIRLCWTCGVTHLLFISSLKDAFC